MTDEKALTIVEMARYIAGDPENRGATADWWNDTARYIEGLEADRERLEEAQPIQHVCTHCGYITATQYGEHLRGLLAAAESRIEELEKAGTFLVAYRKRVGARSFQLEKMDDYIQRLVAALAKEKP